MKRSRKLLMIMILVGFISLVACKSSEMEAQVTHDKQEETWSEGNVDEKQDDDVDDADENSQENLNRQTDLENSEKNTSKTNESINITNGEEAVQFLKQHLEEGKNDDISFGTDGQLETDEKGSYYTVQLVDIPLRVSGKTGNLGYHKVYQDGTYEQYQVTNSQKSEAHGKEEYLQKLNDIQNEMEELRETSQATTTFEMEEEEADRYKIWDEELNNIYGILKDQLNPEQMNLLRAEQRNWIKKRDELAKEASQKYKGGSMESLEYVATQAKLTKERCFELVEGYME